MNGDIRFPVLPESLSQWNIVEKIGEGANGTVFRAEKRSGPLSSECAIKLIHVNSKSNLERMLDEIRIMKKLQGESNLVLILDFECEESRSGIGWDVYILMELLTEFDRFLDEQKHGCLCEQDTIRLGIDICSALEICEENHIIHRDIKEENILIGKRGNFKLGDFGVSCIRNEEEESGTFCGTTFNMAPELIRGEQHSKGTDLYSLGLVMYRQRNRGRAPFVSGEGLPNIGQMKEAETRRLSGEALPKPAYASDGLADVILKACSFDQEQRFKTAGEMRKELEQLLSAAKSKDIQKEGLQEVTVTAEGTSEKKKKEEKKGQKNRILWHILFSLFAIAVIFLVGMILGEKKEGKKLETASERQKNDPLEESTEEIAEAVFKIEDGTLIDIEECGNYVKIPEGVTSLSYSCFDSKMDVIRHLELPASLGETPIEYFWTIFNLDRIDVQEGNAFLSSKDGVLYDKSGETLLLYPPMKQETTFIIPNGVKTVEESAFFYCLYLSHLVIPESLEELKEWGISFCSNLENITVNSNNKNYVSDKGVLFNRDRTELLLYPPGMKGAAYSIPDGVKRIGVNAFAESVLISVQIPEGLTEIGEMAFESCHRLNNVVLPKSLKTIERDAFSYCSSLTDISVEEGNPYFIAINGTLFNKSMTELIYYPSGKQTLHYEVPDGVKIIKAHAFCFSNVQEVVIPKSVELIEDRAFSAAEKLQKVIAFCDEATLGEELFYGCSSVEVECAESSVFREYMEKNNAPVTLLEEDTEGESDFSGD